MYLSIIYMYTIATGNICGQIFKGNYLSKDEGRHFVEYVGAQFSFSFNET